MRLARRIAVSDPASTKGSPAEWLLSGDASRAGPVELLDGLMTRLFAAGMPFERATIHLGTLHPQVLGFTAVWDHSRGSCSEFRVDAHIRETDDFRLSPLKPVIEGHETVRLDPRNPETASRYPMMAELSADGMTDYCAFAIPHARSFHCAMTVATRRDGGLESGSMQALQLLLPMLALNLDIIALTRIAENVLTAYVGERSGARVLAGEIKRGSGEMIDAIVWVSDMRDYTGLSDRLAGEDLIRLLNAYFERLVEAVQSYGGEVLKFIGDGMLAVFPIGPNMPASTAASAALNAARAAFRAVDALNGKQGDALAIDTSWRPLKMGIALHRGPVFYGNIGAADRLDFTVTGPAVNLAARVEPLCKETLRRLLLTEAVGALLTEPLEPLGSFDFRGVAHPVALFTAPN